MSKIINLKDEAERQFNSFVKEVQTERDQANCKHKSWLFDEDGEYMECAQCKKVMAPIQFCMFLAYESNGVRAKLRNRYMVLEEIECRIKEKEQELKRITSVIRKALRE